MHSRKGSKPSQAPLLCRSNANRRFSEGRNISPFNQKIKYHETRPVHRNHGNRRNRIRPRGFQPPSQGQHHHHQTPHGQADRETRRTQGQDHPPSHLHRLGRLQGRTPRSHRRHHPGTIQETHPCRLPRPPGRPTDRPHHPHPGRHRKTQPCPRPLRGLRHHTLPRVVHRHVPPREDPLQ